MDYQNIKTKNIGGNVVEIEGEITVAAMEKHKKTALRDVQKDFKMPGFRKGQVPEEIILKNADGHKLTEEAANLALSEAFPLIIEEQKLEIIGTPRVSVTKIAAGNPLGFKITVGVKPAIKLPDYKKIAAGVIKNTPETEIKVADEEVNKLVEEIKKIRNVEEITDETVKKIGSFQNVADFREKIRTNLTEEKRMAEKRKLREAIARKLVEESELEIPAIVIEEELVRDINYLNEELNRRNITLEDYFKKTNRTEEQFIKDKRKSLEDQLKVKFIIEEIAEKENIKPADEEVERHARLIELQNPGGEPLEVRTFATALITHEKTLQFLEDSGAKNGS